jgi:hypothetical protein
MEFSVEGEKRGVRKRLLANGEKWPFFTKRI